MSNVPTMAYDTCMACIIKVHAVLLQLAPVGMPSLQTLTEREADNFGIFLRASLQSTQGWWVS